MKKLFLLPLLLIFAACESDEKIPLTNRYFKLAEIVALPALQYDNDGSPPDLYVEIKRRSASFWEFYTDVEINAGLPTYLVFPAEILATDEMYEIRIMDEDPNEPADYEVFYWQFHAIDDGYDGGIDFEDPLTGNLVMVLNYNEK